MGVTSNILIQIPKERKHITGKPIQGIVKFHLQKDTVYQKISLSLVEEGNCSWDEHELSYRARHIQQDRQRRKVGNRYMFEGHETNVVMKIYFLNKNTDENTTLSAGSYEHPFEMVIPENVPPSVKTDIAEVKYYLVLKFKRPESFSGNKNFKRKITIYPSVDSTITDKPLIFALDKTFVKLFSSNKQEISLKAELKKGYLTPSSERKISFVVTNNSNVSFSVKTELISQITYTDDYIIKKLMFDGPKTVREVINSCTVESPTVPDNSVSNMFNIIPVAPDLCTVKHSKIITREYKLRVTLKLPLPHINSSVEIPVFVGERVNNNNDVEAGTSSSLREDPPSYWEAMYEDKAKE